mmetsp:Transcript_10041/g.21714  ORF Transcript_10041/g.21714 Transcript_10041/m.21714 type:complete len:260 (-) Transcript_10041:1731-2510(-)
MILQPGTAMTMPSLLAASTEDRSVLTGRAESCRIESKDEISSVGVMDGFLARRRSMKLRQQNLTLTPRLFLSRIRDVFTVIFPARIWSSISANEIVPLLSTSTVFKKESINESIFSLDLSSPVSVPRICRITVTISSFVRSSLVSLSRNDHRSRTPCTCNSEESASYTSTDDCLAISVTLVAVSIAEGETLMLTKLGKIISQEILCLSPCSVSPPRSGTFKAYEAFPKMENGSTRSSIFECLVLSALAATTNSKCKRLC